MQAQTHNDGVAEAITNRFSDGKRTVHIHPVAYQTRVTNNGANR
jgi:hypothetical protein